jgi:hypothetical protein
MSSNLDKLIAIARAGEAVDPLTELEQFVMYYQLYPDMNRRVQNAHLYWLYMDWKININDTKLLTRRQFSRQIGKMFPKGRNGMYRFIQINGNGLDLTKADKRAVVLDILREKGYLEWLKSKLKGKRHATALRTEVSKRSTSQRLNKNTTT